MRRLSVYFRCLAQLEEDGVKTISSQELAARFHLNSAQVRKDLAYFGEFGIRGIGYDTAVLRAEIQRILGLDREWRVVLVGFGNLGSALFHYRGFARQGFRIAAIVDDDAAKVGRSVNGLVIGSARPVLRRCRARIIEMTTWWRCSWKRRAHPQHHRPSPARISCNSSGGGEHAAAGLAAGVLPIDLKVPLLHWIGAAAPGSGGASVAASIERPGHRVRHAVADQQRLGLAELADRHPVGIAWPAPSAWWRWSRSAALRVLDDLRGFAAGLGRKAPGEIVPMPVPHAALWRDAGAREEEYAGRAGVLGRLLRGEPLWVIVPVRGLEAPLPPPATFRRQVLTLAPGDAVDRDAVVESSRTRATSGSRR